MLSSANLDSLVVGCIKHSSTMIFDNLSCPNLDNTLGGVEIPRHHPKGMVRTVRGLARDKTTTGATSGRSNASEVTSNPANYSLTRAVGLICSNPTRWYSIAVQYARHVYCM